MNSSAPNCNLLGPWKAIRTPFLEVSLLCDQGIDWGGAETIYICCEPTLLYHLRFP